MAVEQITMKSKHMVTTAPKNPSIASNFAELSRFMPKAPVTNPAKAMVEEIIEIIVVATSS